MREKGKGESFPHRIDHGVAMESSSPLSLSLSLSLCVFHFLSMCCKIRLAYGHDLTNNEDGCVGAIMQKPLAIQKCFGQTDGQTDQPSDGPAGQGKELHLCD